MIFSLWYAANTIIEKFSATTSCAEKNFLGFPTWYHYLPYGCDFNGLKVQDFGLIGLAVVEILLRIAGLVAVGYIIWGGVQLITAQGDPGATKKARQTIVNALIGMVIALISTGIVRFIGHRVG